ncbi:MAG: hypothetical protein IKN55_10105 [Oscillospiraceae bacterium]|nr:hypothetical protein [Oscillospiraceae bacterium]
MRRIGIVCGLVIGISLMTGLAVHGEDALSSGLSELLQDAGTDSLTEGLDPEHPETLTGISFWHVLSVIGAELRTTAEAPLRTFLLLCGVILMTAVSGGLQGENGAAGTVCQTISVLCAVCIAVPPLSKAFAVSSAVLTHTADFTAGFSVIYAGVLAAGGGVTSAAVYQSSMAAVCQLAMEISTRVLLPMLGMCMAMSIVDAVNPAVSLAGILQLLQKTTVWILGLLMAVFLGLLSVQSLVSVAADRAGTKAAKYMISGFVPIIGGAVSDAYTALLGSMGVLRTGAGTVGIAAMLSLLLPVLLELGVYRLLAGAAAAVSELFGTAALTRLFRDLGAVLAAGFSIAVSFSVMFIFSTAVMMLISGNLSG